jgi:nitrite reductase (NO-forming)
MTGDNAIQTKVGETVRLYVGNGGPNLVSPFHVIGEIFDRVNIEGGSTINENVQTTLVPAGGSTIVEIKTDVPGTFIAVDHSIFRAFNKGALGMLKVSGSENKMIYSGKQDESIYQPEGEGIQSIDETSTGALLAKNKRQRILFGQRIYEQNCMACHQSEGQGIPGAFSPLAGSDYLLSDPKGAINVLLKGLSGPVTVNGITYNGVMPAVQLSDEKVANVLTYIPNSWNNNGGEIIPVHVAESQSSH